MSIRQPIRDNVKTGDDEHFLSQTELLQLNMLEVFERVTSKVAPGPAPSFNEAHVAKALEIIDKEGTIGRTTLSNRLELGIATTRTILKHLQKEGLISSSRHGFEFSEYGRKLFSELRLQISDTTEVPNSPLAVGPVVVAIKVSDTAHKVGRGVEQRNTAIRAGASGATTLVFSNNILTMASKNRHSTDEAVSGIQGVLVPKLSLKENDVVVIGSGENKTNAEIGAIMAAFRLLKSEDAK